ncbi:hypothetical protein EJ07DRAFT_66071, partial [Lizonia empirigonia]
MASFAEILAKQPKVKTRQALMIIGLQNDFIAPSGYLPVATTSGFLDNIHALVPKFRELDGHIIWVQTLYEADRLANTSSTGEGDALVIAGLVDGEEISSHGGDDELTKDLPLPIPQAQSRSAKHRQRALDLFKRVSSRRKALPVEEAKATVEEDEELFLLKRPKKGAACMPETEGVQFSKDIKKLIETPRDAVIKTTNYSAFLGTNLLLTLRARLVTEIYVCGCLTNISVLATVIDGARHGIKINVIQDALGFRKEFRHELALKRMEDVFDAWMVTSAEILAKEYLAVVEPTKEEAKEEGKPDATDPKKPKDELEALVGKLSLAEKPDDAARTPNGHATSKTNGRFAKDASGSQLLVAAEEGNRAEQNSTDAGETKLVQSRTRMRKKKKKKPTEGSLVEPGMRTSESNKSITQASAKPAPAMREELDPPRTAALDVEAESNNIQKQDDGAKQSPDKTHSQPVIQGRSGSADTTIMSPAKAIPDKSKGELSIQAPKDCLTTPQISTPIVLPSQPMPVDAGASSVSPASSGLATMTKSSKLKSLANLPMLGPRDRIVEGDSRIVHDLIPLNYCHPGDLSKPLVDTIFQQLYNEVRWQKMLHQQGEVPRLVCCQGESGDDGSKPVYRHPADQTLPLLHFSPKVQWIRRAAEKIVGHPLNHVLIQLYRSGNDYISEHSDKTLDIAKDSSIVNVSFGAQRTMRLRTKRDIKSKTAVTDEDIQRETQRVAMPHNSMFVLGLKSNEKWLHGIMADKRIDAERNEAETAYTGARISLTFRHIATFLDAKESVIWGQGATSKEQRGAADVVNDDEAEAERMIRAFSRENHNNEFNWEQWYGEGFDVLHLHKPPELVPILFASNNAIETKQVQLALWESKINHTLLEAPGLDKLHSSSQPVHFRDNDTHFTEVSGLRSVLYYIDRYYPLCSDKPVTAAAYTLLEMISRIPEFFPTHAANPAPPSSATETPGLAAALHVLSEQLKDNGGPFIAGKRFSIADCVVWPVLDEYLENRVHGNDLEWPELAEYYRLTWKKKACLKKLRG